ncbi:hypothetical protein QCD79_33370, partial [Pseudomonas quasicaspiana]|nr:hypothetical protein [Pseudomonas quasicaspiana]
ELKNLIAHLNSKSIKLSVEALKHTQVHVNDHKYQPIISGPAFNWLIFVVIHMDLSMLERLY